MTIPFGKVAWELCKDYLYIQNQMQLANEATIGKRNIYLRDEDLELANLLPDWQQLRFQKQGMCSGMGNCNYQRDLESANDGMRLHRLPV